MNFIKHGRLDETRVTQKCANQPASHLSAHDSKVLITYHI